MKSSSTSLVFKHILIDILREILFLPIWWYTFGLGQMVVWCGASIRGAAQTTGFTLWAKNLFVPMYGETTLSGKIISFFVRLVMVMIRGIGTLFLFLTILAIFLLYLIVFPASLLGVLYHGLGMVFV